MYWIILGVFILGVGSGVGLVRVGWVMGKPNSGGEGEADSLKINPFLDEVDTEVADVLREEGAKSVQDRIEKRKDKILAKAKAEGRITNDGVEDLFCISDRTAGNYLTQLVEEGKLLKIGNTGRGVYYEVV